MIPEEFLRLRTIPLRQAGQGISPYHGAGCMAIIKGKKCFLTVHHLFREKHAKTNKKIPWAIEVVYSPKHKETLQYELGNTQWESPLRSGKSKFDYYDFATEILPDDFKPTWTHFDKSNGNLIFTKDRLPVSLQYKLPSKRDIFGFAGHSNFEGDGNVLIPNNDVLESNMRFVQKKGHFYIFNLANKHKGHEYYKGCSGAPIMDSAGEVYALVAGGNIRKNQIYGISLASVKELIESTVVI
jgi:hypothetical protein